MIKKPSVEELTAISQNSGKGANRARLASWGVPWPPPNGWLKALMAEALERNGSAILRSPATSKNIARKQVLAKRKEKRKNKRRRETSPHVQKQAFEPIRSRTEKDAFYLTWEWKKLRMKALERGGRRCACCGATPADGIRLVVDHIKPLGEFWSLRLELQNLQVLCDDCNMGKGNWLHKDFRTEEPEVDGGDPLMAEFREIMRS